MPQPRAIGGGDLGLIFARCNAVSIGERLFFDRYILIKSALVDAVKLVCLLTIAAVTAGKRREHAPEDDQSRGRDQEDEHEHLHEQAALELVAIGCFGTFDCEFPDLVTSASNSFQFVSTGDTATPGEPPKEPDNKPSNEAASRQRLEDVEEPAPQASILTLAHQSHW